MLRSLRESFSPRHGQSESSGKDPFSPSASAAWSPISDIFDKAASLVRHPAPPIEGVHPRKNLLEMYDLDILKDATGRTHLYQLSNGTPIGVTFAEKQYQVDSAYIKDSPLRKKVSANLEEQHPGQTLMWRENAGVFHLGGQISSFLPVAAFMGGSVGPSFGVSADVFVRYRSLQVQVDGESKRVPIPITTDLALKMEPGSDFEFIGHVGAGFSAGVFVAEGYVMGPALVGAAAYSNVGIGAVGEIGICVTALEEKGHVRVTVRRIGKAESSSSIGVTAGLMYQVASNWTSTIGAHASLLPNTSTTSNYLNAMTSLSNASLGLSAGRNTMDTRLYAVDIDLKTKKGREIYKQMLRLQCVNAIENAKRNPKSARVALANETTKGTNRDVILKVLGEVLLQDSQNKRYITGNSTLPSGEAITYTDSTIGDTQKCWGLGSREVKWQEVSVQQKDVVPKAPYLRFRYTNTDNRFNSERLHKFLRFADSLGIDREKLIDGKGPRLAALEERLNKAAKVDLNVDVFFSTAGIEKILASSEQEIQKAYIMASQKTIAHYEEAPLLLEGKMGDKARDWLRIFEERLSRHRFDIFGVTKEINECYVQYKGITQRSLSVDYALLNESENFARMISCAKKQGCVADCAEMLFIELGKKKGFHYQQSIATLFRLAGREETRIHALSLVSGTIKLEVPAEEELTHPQEQFAAHVVS